MTQTVRPPTRPTPVTTPSAGVSGSSERAKSQSSWNWGRGSRRSFSRSGTKSLPSSRSFSRYFVCPCSIRARSWKYRSSPSPRDLRSGIRVRPDDDDQDAGAGARPADDRWVARLRLDVGPHLGEVTAGEAHLELHGASPHALRRDLELAVAGHGPAVGGADGHLGPVALQGGVLLVAEVLPELREEAVQTLVGPRRREPHAGRRRRVAGEHDAGTEAHDLLRRGRCRREEDQEGEDHTEQRAEHRAQALARVVQTRHDGSHRDPQHLCDLSVREALEITQHDNRAVMLRQSVERARDPPPRLGARRAPVGRLPWVDQLPLPLLLLDALGSERPPARGALAGAVGRHVHGDPEQPGVEGRLSPERRERLPGADEHLLGDVPRVLPVAQDVEREAVDARAIFFDQGLERGDVAGDATLDQGEIDRKSTRLNSSHLVISYAVFCLKKKKKIKNRQ